jgi:Tfp pilus assembly protein PilF
MTPPRHRNRGRILLARAYAKNPNWLRKAEDQLQDVVRTDPAHVEAHYQLGLLYKAQGLTARAQAMFRRVLELRPDHRDAAAEVGGAGASGGGFLRRLFRRGKAS